MVIAKKYVLNNYFVGEPKPTDFSLVEEKLPALKDGEYLIRATFISVDPFIRYGDQLGAPGSTLIGAQVAEIVTSKNKEFPVGRYVVAYAGWRTYTILDGKFRGFFDQVPYILPDIGILPKSLGLGILGMPGNSAYFPIIEILQPKAGETLVVSGAAGAVGSHVGQVGKIYGLKVIGIAGSDAKCKWLKEELGFDETINYKTQDIAETLSAIAPSRVDCFFDNVGGELSNTVLAHMNTFGRVALCGYISMYNLNPEEFQQTTNIQPIIVGSQLKVEGFLVFRWLDRWMEGIEKNLQWIKEGKLKYPETVTEGFENMFDAFSGMMRGENYGKAIVKV